jgi:multidrug efflux pump subunit AcrA (membrane-fusion protein)
MSGKILNCSGIIAVLFLFGCASKGPQEAEVAPEVTVDVAPVLATMISQKITADAVVYPIQQAGVPSKISAPIKKLYVERGAHVRAGQLVAELESQDLISDVNEANAALNQADVAVQTVNAGVPHELSKVQIEIDGANRAVAEQKSIYDHRKELFDQGGIAEKDVREAAFNLEQAKNALRAAEEKVKDYKGPAKDQELKAAEAARDAAKARVDAANVRLGYARIVSPIDGIVTDRPVFAGELASSGMPLMTVMDTSRVTARAHVSPQEAAVLHNGLTANLIMPGSTSKPISGTIIQISPAMDAGSTTLEVWIETGNSDGALKPGMTLRAEAIVKSNPKALVIPFAAVLTANSGNTSVIVVDAENRPHKKPVTLGIREGANVEVADGLQNGERVVTAGVFELGKLDEDVFDKTKVHIQLPKEEEEE